MYRRALVAAAGSAMLLVLLPGAGTATQPSNGGTPRLYAAGAVHGQGQTPAGHLKRSRGHLSRLNPELFDALKHGGGGGGGNPPPPPPPSPSVGWSGVYNASVTPSDSTGA